VTISKWRCSAHLGYLFKDVPLRDRFVAARTAGFSAVEHPFPMDLAAGEVKNILDGEGLVFAQVATGFGDPSRGEKGIAALTGREREFRTILDETADFANEVGCSLIHPMAGIAESDSKAARDTYLTNLQYALELTQQLAFSVLVEPISHAAVPGYFLSDASIAGKIFGQFGTNARLSILIDTYHARANGDDPAELIERFGPRIGHIHIADYPGRHEPGSGTIDFAALLSALRASDYFGAIGFEYIPASGGFEWLDAFSDEVSSRRGTERRGLSGGDQQ
jgi:hydroxypyruvate isomerase